MIKNAIIFIEKQYIYIYCKKYCILHWFSKYYIARAIVCYDNKATAMNLTHIPVIKLINIKMSGYLKGKKETKRKGNNKKKKKKKNEKKQ